ncbi:CRISPR-associated protein Csx18 [Gloeobacter kilaueensis]|uniref:Uncharacterized protein n=1 Tax=Gloeobacter kilaueensis (strain ATCC BAA-2537 / CCAP 1431/1 / ULC 316 / JS1) TaxID=1183438 RepID=U5QMW9_GLOK1|nr:CRISPR-associated protein Csx18 [Gloeobacter kilaueensis]AGY60307.1 hypothetical protein GKIL_4061 [Gloeobacter kilaueensis JS1]
MNSARLLFFRNVAVASVNTAVTLVILLIAPLGLAAVLTCTVAVGLSSLIIGLCADQVARWLFSDGGLAVRAPRE